MLKEKNSLGESLVEKKIITKEQLASAEQESKLSNEPLRKTLVRLNMVKETDIISFFEQYLHIPYVDLSSYIIDPKMIALITEEFANVNHTIPLFKAGEILTVAMVDPLNVMVLDELRSRTKCTIEPVLTTETDIKKALNQYYGVGSSIDDVVKKMDTELVMEEKAEEELSTDKIRLAAEQAPIIKLVNILIRDAIKDSASDIHVNPEEKMVRIRYRIDGILHEVSTLPKYLQAAVISRIKIMSDMNIAVKRSPQDGRFRIKIDNNQIDLRISSFPSVHGENIVMRILDPNSLLIGLEQLGFSLEMLEKFKLLIKKPYGMLLVTGPTGSGKTTTLYSALSSINSPEKNIITLEDPVEYQLEMVRQSQINPKAGLTFSTGLRSILRQDPDVVMVGEIRDKETAEISIQAALTGHLVFSTLHTNDSSGALTRLIDMGVEPFLVSSSVIGIQAQRLVRKICKSCKESYTPSEKTLKDLGIEDTKGKIIFYRGKGCKNCKCTGYKGRIGIYELLIMNEKIRGLVLERNSVDAIRKAAQEAGMKTLREDGLKKAFDGVTSIEEVIRATTIE
ncbi:MAG: ATPase, T2SS/T4P/T4SS family [Candidatus Saganbacteria bacterium]|nr:ATPase, T2SS/T4P/T4SS family [Candidatus Saganbacteria bacterium]